MTNLRVRNLTARPISIRGVEQFKDPNTLQSSPTGYFFSSRRPPTAPPLNELEEQAGSSWCQELDVVLEPFGSYLVETFLESKDHDPQTTDTALRLIVFDAEGTRHQINANPAYTQKSSQRFTSLSASSTTSYTALFHPSEPVAHLTIHTNHIPNYQSWMSTLSSDLPLSALSIPGTHNSHTHYRALPSVRCQTVDIKTQLDNGIRFLDIRLQPVHASDSTKKEMYLVHGAFPISLTGPKYFDPILQTCYAFLAQNPSETILISLKREGIGGATDHHFAKILEEQYIRPSAEKWYTGTHIPNLGAARGKLVLVRRFHSQSQDWGLDATAWPASTPHAVFPAHPKGPMFCLQDYYDVLVPGSISTKVQYANEHLGRAAACTNDGAGPLYLNFLSASNFWNKACWPERIAKVVNRGMEEWLCKGHHLADAPVTERRPDRVVKGDGVMMMMKKAEGDGGTGIVIMDFVGDGGDWDLVRLIVGMNMGVLSRFEK